LNTENREHAKKKYSVNFDEYGYKGTGYEYIMRCDDTGAGYIFSPTATPAHKNPFKIKYGGKMFSPKAGLTLASAYTADIHNGYDRSGLNKRAINDLCLVLEKKLREIRNVLSGEPGVQEAVVEDD
jgi:hypothetical protein